MKTTILGIRIPLPVEQTERPELGIYTDEIRWSEAVLVGVSEQWTAGLIAPGGIGEFIQRVDLRRGGGPAIVDATTVTVDNTDQLILKFQELGIYLDGLTAIIEEFEGTTEDSDSEHRETVFTGEIENLSWDEKRLQIRVNSSLSRQRRANIGAVVNSTNRDHLDERIEGKIVPVSFGNSGPDTRRYFKLVRTTSKEKILSVEDIAQFDGVYYPPKMDLFPAFPNYGTPDPLKMNIRIGRYDGGSLTPAKVAELIGKYILIVEGPGENSGVYRKVTEAEGVAMGAGEQYIEVTLRDYLPLDVTGNETGTAEDQTWVHIVDIDRIYEADQAVCKGFTDDPVIYAKEDDRVIRIPHYGLNVNVVDNNRLQLDPLHFRENPNNLSSFIAIPATSLELYDKPDLSAWNTAENDSWGEYLIRKYLDPVTMEAAPVPGLYTKSTGMIGTSPPLNWAFVAPENAIDRKHDTYCLSTYTPLDGDGISNDSIKAVKVVLPPQPQGFTKAYLVVKLSENYGTQPQWWNKKIHILRRGYIDRVKEVTEEIVLKTQQLDEISVVDCTPDFYYNPAPDMNNRNFFRQSPPDENGEYDVYSGYTRFELSANPADYDAIEEVLLAFKRTDMLSANRPDETKIYQVAVIFETTADIEEAVYV